MKELDVDVIFIPKCHCEIAGRGFEFLWGIAKMMIRKESATLDNDKRLNNLQKRVKEIITHMPLETYQRCSRCAREHKLSYAAILRDNAKHFDLKLHHIDNVKKYIESKRRAMDQDFSLAKEMAKSIIDVDAESAAAKHK